jgi:kinetochore protein NDC80
LCPSRIAVKMLTCVLQVTNAQKMASDAQIEKMEKELAKMRAGLSESVQLMEQREMTTNIE